MPLLPLQVSLLCLEEEDGAQPIDAALFHQLPKLNCLTIAGAPPLLCLLRLPRLLLCLALCVLKPGCGLLCCCCNTLFPLHKDRALLWLFAAAGFWGLLDTAALPPRLKHLALRCVRRHLEGLPTGSRASNAMPRAAADSCQLSADC